MVVYAYCYAYNTVLPRSMGQRTADMLYYLLLRVWNTPTTHSRYAQNLCIIFALPLQFALIHAPIVLNRTGFTSRPRDVSRTQAASLRMRARLASSDRFFRPFLRSRLGDANAPNSSET